MKGTDEAVLNEVWEKFGEQQYIFLATADEDQPRVRPVTLIHHQKKFFVATGTEDAKVNQIKNNPKVAFCLMIEEGDQKGTIRAMGQAEIVKDLDIKTDLYNRVSWMKEFWKSPMEPSYTLFRVHVQGFEYMKPGSMQAVKIQF